ncbi:MAG: hypothetical protein AAF394_09515, partial [Planctomycetota bacterium]
ITKVEVGPISTDAATELLIQNSSADAPLRENTTVPWIVDLCEGWPFYLQVMGAAVSRKLISGETRAAVNRAELTQLWSDELIRRRTEVFDGRWKNLPEEARHVLLRLKHGQPPDYRRELSRAERNMVNRCGLCSVAGHWLRDRAFFEWIEHNRSGLEDS